MVLERSFSGQEISCAWPCFWRWHWFAQAGRQRSMAAELGVEELGAEEAAERRRMWPPKAAMVREQRQGLAQVLGRAWQRSFWRLIITAA